MTGRYACMRGAEIASAPEVGHLCGEGEARQVVALPGGKRSPPTEAREPVVVAHSEAMRGVLARVRRLARAELPTIVYGETGTGKELVATLLHLWSSRAGGPLVKFNCAAIPHPLIESELFGHAKGSFTGANSSRRGYFALAHGGTLVLDEVQSLPMEAQPKLLRALEEGEVQVVGGGRPERVDIRVVACTNTGLARAVDAGQFRRDLYYRLATVSVDIPPLRHRRDDIVPLFEYFLRLQGGQGEGLPVRASEDLIEVLPRLAWPGNVRQLRNAVLAMVALAEDGNLDSRLLASVLANEESGTGREIPAQAQPRGWLKARVAEYERALIENALAATGNNCARAARRLGVCRTTLIDLIRRHGIQGRRAGGS